MKDLNNSAAKAPASLPLLRIAQVPRRILVADDDYYIRQLTSKLLTRHGYEVDLAEDGNVAWDAIQVNCYDLLVTDNNMPRVTGIELLKKLHAAHLNLPVLMATGTLPTGEFVLYPWLQPAATLLKPYSNAQLLGTVRDVLQATDVNREMNPPQNWPAKPLINGLEL